jgi:hypothetical protein
MAELTYDPTPADQPEFNEAEQEALAIGEAAAREQEAQYAGKFKDAEELEKAYIELQKKLGETDDETDEGMQREEETAQEEVEVSPAQQLITNASTEFAEKGELSPEVMEEFKSMSSQDLVSAYMEMQGNLPTAPAPDLTEAETNSIKNEAGGDEGYTNLMQWSGENLDPADIEAFDSLVDSGNSRLIRLAVAGLKAEMEKAVGFEGELATGRAPTTTADVFRSQAEVVEAMSDPRYDRDPAYRQDVFDKLDRSNINY